MQPIIYKNGSKVRLKKKNVKIVIFWRLFFLWTFEKPTTDYFFIIFHVANRNKAHNPGCIMFPLFVLYFFICRGCFYRIKMGSVRDASLTKSCFRQTLQILRCSYLYAVRCEFSFCSLAGVWYGSFGLPWEVIETSELFHNRAYSHFVPEAQRRPCKRHRSFQPE